MPACTLDHLVVTAPTLEQGAAYIRESLGVELETGGRHPAMGTHNLLLRLGEGLYLEVISADPAASAPARPRWFGLDLPRPPRLAAWVARTDDLDAVVVPLGDALGRIEPMSRGELEWRITIPPSGQPPFDGTAPMLIQWGAAPHPSARLPERGCRFGRLELRHPDSPALGQLLARIGFQGSINVARAAPGEAPSLLASFETPGGLRHLSSPGAALG